ncbi:MAG: YdcF family protein [Alphaproteobacteria bacterium]|nr:YdcF family protein [Alphaproteobacteria bacterium]
MKIFAVIFRSILLVTFFISLAWTVGFVAYVLQIVHIAQPEQIDNQPTDAIVVLTGGTNRLDTGFQLLSDNYAERLFISGAGHGVTKTDLVKQLKMPPADVQKLLSRVDIGYQADNTYGNAEETARWMQLHQYTSLRLVTANYHILRSMEVFSREMPDVEIIPQPILPEQVKLSEWWKYPGTAKLLISEYMKYLALRLS